MAKLSVDFVHTGPGTVAGNYLRMFWQPVCRSEDLDLGRAVPVRVMSEEFTLYRGDSGQPFIVAFRCPHRGTQLSAGWVEGDCIRCRYHGWKYDGFGQCVEQPGEEESFAQRIKIRSYPTLEYLGLIFTYLGEGEPPPFRRFPDFDRPGLLKAGPPEIWPCNFFQRLENSVDHAHTPFTHHESLRRINSLDLFPGVPEVAIEETEYGIRAVSTFPNRKQTHFFHMPNINQLRVPGRSEGPVQQAAKFFTDRIFWYVPIDDEHCVAYVVNLLPLSGEAAKQYEEEAQQAAACVTFSPNELGETILKGNMRIEDLDETIPSYYTFWVEDYMCIVGQGAIADRENYHLGRVDSRSIILRRIWERELHAFAEGRPVARWASPSEPLLPVQPLIDSY